MTFNFAFSPKYNLSGGYPYLLLEIDRNSSENQTIQYVADGGTYYGTYLDINAIKYQIYSVTPLVGNNTDSTKYPISPSPLNHIGIWGSPGQIFIINGEEIKIGRNNFYELNDFNITRLGAIIEPGDTTKSFTIDYEYQQTTT